MRNKRYSSYKDSGIEAIGNIPAHWSFLPLGRLGRFGASGIDKKSVQGEESVQMVNYTDIYSNISKTIDLSREYMLTTCPPSKAKEHSLKVGDVLFTPSSETEDEIGFSAVVTEIMPHTVYSYHLIRFRPNTQVELDIRFSKYLGNNAPVLAQFTAACKGTTRQILTREDFRTIIVVLPPIDEQFDIATFLDRETTKIDARIAKKERLIELLQEKRTALITHAVTKGLNPNVPMKDSSIEWLGQIPAHWELVPIYSRYDVSLGKMLDAKRITGEHLGCYLRNIDVQWDRINIDDLPQMDFAPYEHERYLLSSGDLLVCEGGEAGRSAIWHGELEKCYYQKAIHRVRPLEKSQLTRFLFYLIYAMTKAGVFEASGNPNTIDHLTAVRLRHHRVPLPPSLEQSTLVAFLDREKLKIEMVMTKVQEAIDRLKEYRTALISAAVTGKIDVRDLG